MPRRFDRAQDYFRALGATGSLQGPLAELVTALGEGRLTPSGHREWAATHGVARSDEYRRAQLDLVLQYVRALIEAGPLTAEDAANLTRLKASLELQEGDFFEYRRGELAELLAWQLECMLDDDVLEDAEDVQQVALQAAFDLSYDQWLLLVRRPLLESANRLDGQRQLARDPRQRRLLEQKLEALAPLVRLAGAQPHGLGFIF